MNIKIEYFGGTIDEYPIEMDQIQKLLDHFWENPNVKSVSFIRVVTKPRKMEVD